MNSVGRGAFSMIILRHYYLNWRRNVEVCIKSRFSRVREAPPLHLRRWPRRGEGAGARQAKCKIAGSVTLPNNYSVFLSPFGVISCGGAELCHSRTSATDHGRKKPPGRMGFSKRAVSGHRVSLRLIISPGRHWSAAFPVSPFSRSERALRYFAP